MPKPLRSHQNRLFSAARVNILRSRLLLFAIIAAFTALDPHLISKWTIGRYLALYLIFIVLFALLKPTTLSLRRVRLIPAIIDVLFITLLVHNSDGLASSWFLLYIFPIISASRYLGSWGALSIATFCIVMQLVSYALSPTNGQLDDPYQLALRCLLLVATAAVAGNLARSRQKEQHRLVQVLEEIDNEILTDAKIETILKLILKKCLVFTNSEMGHIRLKDRDTNTYAIAAVIGHPEGDDWATLPFDETYSKVAIQTREPLVIPQITKAHLRKHFGTYFRLRKPRPRSALFVPLLIKGNVIGVIAVYSRRRMHYTNFDKSTLTAFTTLIELAINTDAARERHRRLQLLNEISDELKSALSLPALFKRVVELTISHVDSEEAALFVRNEKDEQRIDKVEVCGPDAVVTARLRKVEKSYVSGDSLTGKVFSRNEPELNNAVAPEETYAREYAAVLPSRTVKHYLGVPLVVDDEVLGVIRVVNKKSVDYSVKECALSYKGFKPEDLDLMTTIASLVAPELRSAERRRKLVETQRYLKNLLVAAPDPIISLDKRGRIVIFNRACQKLWGVSYEEARDKSVKGFYESTEHAREIGRLLEETEGHRVENLEARIKSKSGETIPISLSAALLFDENNEMDGSIGVFKDLRDHKRMQEELLTAARLSVVAILSRTVGHDIKHNLATALLYVDGLLAKCDKDKDLRLFDIYRNIKDALQESRDELQDLLMADMKPRHKGSFAVFDILRDVEQRLSRKAIASNVRISVIYPAEECFVSVDINQIARIFSNLFTNSRDAINERRNADASFTEGLIEVSAYADGASVNFTWTDNGCGIPKEDSQRIFDAFFTKKQGDIGSGLGLHIIKTIVEAHSGQIRVSPKPGKGAHFCMTLPLTSASP